MTPAQAAAQAWLADRERAEGEGIRLGDFELHPGIGAEGGYDSNVFLADDEDGVEDSAILRVAPHIHLANREVEGQAPPRVRLRTGVDGNLKHYFATEQGTNLNLRQNLRLTINPERQFTAELRESYGLSQDPFTEPASPTGTGTAFDRHTFSVGPYFRLSTPGGLLGWGVGYSYNRDYFPDSSFKRNSTQSHRIYSDASWEFLPKTGLFWEGSVLLRDYDNVSVPGGPLVERNDSTEPRARLGINGALTSTLGFTLAAGYGAGFFEDDQDYEAVLAQAELRWRPRRTITAMAGYERSANNAFQGNFATLNRFKAGLRSMFGGVFALGLNGELTLVDFGRDERIVEAAREAVDADPSLSLSNFTAERDDIHLRTTLSGEYRFTDWFAVTAELGYLANLTDFIFPPAVGEDADGDPVVSEVNRAEYERFEAWLGARAFF